MTFRRVLCYPGTRERFRALMRQVASDYRCKQASSSGKYLTVDEWRGVEQSPGDLMDWVVQQWSRTTENPIACATITAGPQVKPEDPTFVSFLDGLRLGARGGGTQEPIGQPFEQLCRVTMRLTLDQMGIQVAGSHSKKTAKRTERFQWPVDTNADMFEHRITVYLRELDWRLFPTSNGAVQVLGVRSHSDSPYVRTIELVGDYWSLSPGKGMENSANALVRLTVLLNTLERVDVVLECLEPALSSPFEELKREVQRIWPQTTLDLSLLPELPEPDGSDRDACFRWFWSEERHRRKPSGEYMARKMGISIYQYYHLKGAYDKAHGLKKKNTAEKQQ